MENMNTALANLSSLLNNLNGISGSLSTGSGSSASTGDQGNNQLSAAFDKAMERATKTLEITTEKGAELYALKQSVR